ASVDFLARQTCRPLGAELRNVEGSQNRAVAHRTPQVGLAWVGAEAVEVAEKAAGEAVARTGRVAHILKRETGQGEEALGGEEGGTVLTLLGDHGARAKRHHRPGRTRQV